MGSSRLLHFLQVEIDTILIGHQDVGDLPRSHCLQTLHNRLLFIHNAPPLLPKDPVRYVVFQLPLHESAVSAELYDEMQPLEVSRVDLLYYRKSFKNVGLCGIHH